MQGFAIMSQCKKKTDVYITQYDWFMVVQLKNITVIFRCHNGIMFLFSA